MVIDRDLYPFASHFHALDSGPRLHYLDEGSGDPVVLLHGNPSWSFYYRALVQALRPTHRTIVPDHIGCGLSDKPALGEYPYDLKSRVDDLESLLDKCEVKGNVTLVMHDWGGMIGMAYASRHPDRIARLVVLNTAAFPLPAAKPLPPGIRICRDTALGAFLVLRLNAFVRAWAWVGTKRGPLSPGARASYFAPYDSPQNRVAVLRFVQDIPLGPNDPGFDIVTEVADRLDQFRDRPMLICWGEQDFVFDHHFLAEWERRFPAAEVHRFPNAGHLVLEDETAAVVAHVQAFLKSGNES